MRTSLSRLLALLVAGCAPSDDSSGPGTSTPPMVRVAHVAWDTLPQVPVTRELVAVHRTGGILELWFAVHCQPQGLSASVEPSGDSLVVAIRSAGSVCLDWLPPAFVRLEFTGDVARYAGLRMLPVAFARSLFTSEDSLGLLDLTGPTSLSIREER